MATHGHGISGTNNPHEHGNDKGKKRNYDNGTRMPKAEIQQINGDVSKISNPK